MENPKEKRIISCFQCGAGLICGALNGDATCWCNALPNIIPLTDETTGCYCRECLAQKIKEKVAATE